MSSKNCIFISMPSVRLGSLIKISVLLWQGLASGEFVASQYGYHNMYPDSEYAAVEDSSLSLEQRVAWEPKSLGPRFDRSPPQRITAMKNGNAFLNCIVHNLANNTVSWIREKDLHILSVNNYAYTADDRFQVIHPEGSNMWKLKINSVQPRDSGRYECQVNTHPTNPITFPVTLDVFVPTSKILGSHERYVDRGSTINLTCIINYNPEPATEMFWYHNKKLINYDSPESRISVLTDRNDRGNVTKTILLIHDASDAASGTYSCAPSPSAEASVRIVILNGEKHAAIHTNRSPGLMSYFQHLCLHLFAAVILQLHLST